MAQASTTTNLIPLAEAVAAAPPEHILQVGLEAHLTAPLVGGEYPATAMITGSLGERTIVVTLEDGSCGVARLQHLLVDPDSITWIPVRRPKSSRWQGAEPDEQVAEELAEQRRASDQRALQDQGRARRKLDKERRRRPTAQPMRPSRAPAAIRAELGDGQFVIAVDPTRIAEDSPTAVTPSPARGEEGTELHSRSPAPLDTETRAAASSQLRRRRERTREGQGEHENGPEYEPAQVAGGPNRTDQASRDPAPCPAPPSPTVEVGRDVHSDAKSGTRAHQDPERDSDPGAVNVGPAADAVGEASQPKRCCEECGGPLRRHNTTSVCSRCRTTCPGCGGQKAILADRCFECRLKLRATERTARSALAHASNATGDVVADAARGRDPEPGSDCVDAHAGVAPAQDLAAETSRTCDRCRRPLPGQNRKGICAPCQATCPTCAGPKVPDAERCRACSRKAQLGLADEALALAGSLALLPGQLRELVDAHATLARYAKALEDELEDYRAAERGMHRIRRRALAATGSQS